MKRVLFTSSSYDRYDADCTLPSKFGRLLDATGLEDKVRGRLTAVKMHVGRGIGYSTIHPLFVKILADRLRKYGAKVFITDHEVRDAASRGYREEYLGCPVVEVCGATGKYFYENHVDFGTFKNADIAGHIQDAEFLIDLSHVKGHGSCGFGGAIKNLAMGCVTDRTRQQIHGLEGGLDWNGGKCTHCGQCIKSCGHYANAFDSSDEYEVNYHHCTLCQHCAKVCPTGAITVTDNKYGDFQTGMAIATKAVLDAVGLERSYFINFLTNITAVCDCWGLTTPSIVPDIGIMASEDIVAVERASIDAIKLENLLQNGVPAGMELGTEGHLLERLHGKNLFLQLEKMEEMGLGTQEYSLDEVF